MDVNVRQNKKKAHRVRRQKPKSSDAGHDALLELVRDGVRRFILNGARIIEFKKAVSVLSRKGKESHHPLTRVVFRRIVKDAVRERRRRTSHR